MNKTALLSLSLIFTGTLQTTHAIDWDIAAKTLAYTAISPAIHAVVTSWKRTPKTRMITRGIAAAACGILSIGLAHDVVVYSKSGLVADEIKSCIAAFMSGAFGGLSCTLAEDVYDEYQNEKAWAKYHKESAAALKAREELQTQEDTQILVTFGDDPKI
jgi:hypothetical protein